MLLNETNEITSHSFGYLYKTILFVFLYASVNGIVNWKPLQFKISTAFNWLTINARYTSIQYCTSKAFNIDEN